MVVAVAVDVAGAGPWTVGLGVGFAVSTAAAVSIGKSVGAITGTAFGSGAIGGAGGDARELDSALGTDGSVLSGAIVVTSAADDAGALLPLETTATTMPIATAITAPPTPRASVLGRRKRAARATSARGKDAPTRVTATAPFVVAAAGETGATVAEAKVRFTTVGGTVSRGAVERGVPCRS
jgi:hypothetical protein